MKKEIKMNNILNSNTLLGSFIKNKIKNYTPPTREGTPKGKAIGFPLNKFKASLFFLTRLSLKEIASSAGVSYGVLRIWTTEEKFKKLINKHYSEFVSLNIEHNEERARKKNNLHKKHFKKSIKEFAKTSEPVLGLDEYKDIGLYSNLLLKNIADVMINICKSFDSLETAGRQGFDVVDIMERAYQADYVLMLIKDVADTPTSQRNYTVFNTIPKSSCQISETEFLTALTSSLKCAEILLAKNRLTNKDRKIAISLVSLVRRKLKQDETKELFKASELGYKLKK